MVSGHSVQPFGRPWRLADDLLLRFGSDGDAAVALVSAANSADAEVTNLIEGTSDHQGTAANSLVLSNVTDDGDIQMLVSDGGNSKEFLFADGSEAILYLGHGMASTSFSDGNITNVGNIALDTISSDAGTTVSVTLGTDAGDDFIVGNNSALVVEGDNDKVGIGTDTPAYPLTIKGAHAKLQILGTANDEVVGLYFARPSSDYAGWFNSHLDTDVIDFATAVGVKMKLSAAGLDLNNNDLLNVGASGDGWTTGVLTSSYAGALDITINSTAAGAMRVMKANGEQMLSVETRPNGLHRYWDFSAPASNVGISGRNDIHKHLMRLSAFTTTLPDTTTVSGAWEGMMLEIGAGTIDQSGAGSITVTTASAVHIEALVAGTDTTITNNRMISTSVADCYLTAAGVWTDTSSTAKVKDNIVDLPLQDVGDLISQIRPRTYTYKDSMEDHGRTRYGAVAEEFPDFLRVPGDASHSAVNSTVLANFALVANVYLADKYEELNERLEAIGA